jgi:regulation of enolase protein 1 (concanavalin A-like superfamily)
VDTAGIKLGVLLLAGLFAACTPKEEVAKTPLPTPAATPVISSPEKVTKTINVSFSTYSHDWPVGWEWIDPDPHPTTPHNVKSQVLAVSIPTGKNLEPHALNNAPRYLKALTGDFEIRTLVDFLPKQNFQAAGLIVYWNGDSFVRFERYFGRGGEGIHLAAATFDGMERVANVETASPSVELRLIRKGTLFSTYWRGEGEKEWKFVGQTDRPYADTLMVGLAAYNTAEPVTAKFGYITLDPVK